MRMQACSLKGPWMPVEGQGEQQKQQPVHVAFVRLVDVRVLRRDASGRSQRLRCRTRSPHCCCDVESFFALCDGPRDSRLLPLQSADGVSHVVRHYAFSLSQIPAGKQHRPLGGGCCSDYDGRLHLVLHQRLHRMQILLHHGRASDVREELQASSHQRTAGDSGASVACLIQRYE